MNPLTCRSLTHIPVLILFLLLLLTANATDIACDRAYYGAPHFGDCYQLLSFFPSMHGANPRLFVEQQLREAEDHSWAGVHNPYQDAVVQVPKYWTHSPSSRQTASPCLLFLRRIE